MVPVKDSSPLPSGCRPLLLAMNGHTAPALVCRPLMTAWLGLDYIPLDLLSTHLAQGPGFGTTAAHGGEAVTRKLHVVYRVCWATARATQAWPHTITLYSLRPSSSQSTNDTGPHGNLH